MKSEHWQLNYLNPSIDSFSKDYGTEMIKAIYYNKPYDGKSKDIINLVYDETHSVFSKELSPLSLVNSPLLPVSYISRLMDNVELMNPKLNNGYGNVTFPLRSYPTKLEFNENTIKNLFNHIFSINSISYGDVELNNFNEEGNQAFGKRIYGFRSSSKYFYYLKQRAVLSRKLNEIDFDRNFIGLKDSDNNEIFIGKNVSYKNKLFPIHEFTRMIDSNIVKLNDINLFNYIRYSMPFYSRSLATMEGIVNLEEQFSSNSLLWYKK